MKRKRVLSLLLALAVLTTVLALPLPALAVTNLARSATAIASSEFNSGFGIAKLNDGVRSGANTDRWTTDWGASADNRNEWFGVEFSAPTEIDQITFYEYDSRITEYKVEYQDGDGNWKTVQKDGLDLPNQTKAAKEGVNTAHSVANTVTFDLTEVSGIRVYVVDMGAKTGVSVWEFEAYNTQAVDATTNLATLRGTGIADPDKSVTDARFLAAMLNDANTSGTSRWSSNWGLSAEDVAGVWAGIQFNAQTAFDKITVKEFNGRVTKFAVEVSDDGTNWTAVKQGGTELPVQEKPYEKKCTNDLRTYDVTFDRVKASYVRYRVVEAGEAGVSLWELEVYDSLAGAPFPDTDDETVYRADVDSVTIASLLGGNADEQNVTEDLALPPSPLSGGTVVGWSVTEGGAWLSADGTVTRPLFGEGDQQATLQASFASRGGTYHETQDYQFTILEAEQQAEPVVLLQEDYTSMPGDTDLTEYNWSAYETSSGDIVHADNGTMTINNNTLEMKKTIDSAAEGYGLHKSFKHYEKSYAPSGSVDETRTAVWSDKLKGKFDVEIAWRFSGSTSANYIDFQGKRKKSADEYGSLARLKGPAGTTSFLSIYNNGSYNGQKESQLYKDTTKTRTVKLRFDTTAGKFQVYLDGSETPADALNVTTNPKNLFEMTDYSAISKRYYMDNLQIYLAKEQPQNASICIDSFSLAQVEKTADVTDTAARQLTMSMVCDDPADTVAVKELPSSLAGANITWTSSNAQVIEVNGTTATIRKPIADTDVVLTAAIANPEDGYDKHKEFKLTVKAREVDDETLYRADVDSVTETSLLGANVDADHVISNLALTASPMANGTTVEWNVTAGSSWVSNTGAVTRPSKAEGSQTITLQAQFKSPNETYQETKSFTYTVLYYDAAEEENEKFQQDVAGVTEALLLGANPDAQHVKYHLNLPVSPLQNGTKVAWSVKSGTAVNENGMVTQPAQNTEEVTLEAAFTKSSGSQPEQRKEFVFTVLPREEGAWNLVENIKIDQPRGSSAYAVTQIKDGVATSTAELDGVKFTQVTNEAIASADRPDMKLNFSDKIKNGKKYYIEVTLQADMKAGEARVLMLNGTEGEGALFIFRTGNTLGLAANKGSGRVWVDSEVKINHTHGQEETIGIFYNPADNTFQFVSNGNIASKTNYKTSYGSGISGIQVSHQGGANGKNSYIATKSVKVYEYNEAFEAQVGAELDALDYSALTQQDPAYITENLALPPALPSGVPIEWTSSVPTVISNGGAVTRPTNEGKQVRLTAKITSQGLNLSKTFDFTVLWTGDKRAELNEDMAQVTYESLTAEHPQELTQNLRMPPAALPNGTNVTWTTSNTGVLAMDGTVTRAANRKQGVKLTVSFQNGELTGEKVFFFGVLPEGAAPENLAKGARVMTSAAASGGAVTDIIDGDYGTSWKTETKQSVVVFDLGSVKPISAAYVYGTQKASLEVSQDNVNYTKIADLNAEGFCGEATFPVTEARYICWSAQGETAELNELEVFFAPDDASRVKADVKAFQYTNPKLVSADITLPQETKYGSELTWSSSDPAVMDNTGHVTRAKQNQDVTLTAAFRSGEVKETVLIYHTVKGTGTNSTPGGSGGGGGGGGSSSGGSGGVGMQIPIVQPGPDTPQPTPQPQTGRFSDVSKDRWSYSYIERLAQQGVIDGSGGAFDPEGMLTREELVKLVVTALDIDIPDGAAAFSDVQESEWYSRYIAAAAQAGIISGVSETVFGVGQYVSREDMATMICRALEYAGVDLAPGQQETNFADGGQVSDYAQEAVNLLASNGILSGDSGNFLPGDKATREQSAKVLCMVLDEIGR